jgi:hypothetical protein
MPVVAVAECLGLARLALAVLVEGVSVALLGAVMEAQVKTILVVEEAVA